MTRRASPSDTICAIATAVGEAAVAIIRISGTDAIGVARRVAPGLRAVPAHRRAYVARLRVGSDLLDEAVLLVFRAPHSFTGEDVVELQCHGGVLNTRRVLDAVIDAGARPAEPGEFTRRAMLNGRLDLTQVEAIADVIHARSEAALRLAQRHLAGELRVVVEAWREALIGLLVLVEAGIDFSLEEHIFVVRPEQIAAAIEPVRGQMTQLLAGFDSGRVRYDGVRVALVGRPNAGKSSLLNALLGTHRAIVTDIPGTTRDSVEESIELGGIHFRIADTAGLRDATDQIEQLGIARSRELASQADVVVFVVDATRPGDLTELRTELGTGAGGTSSAGRSGSAATPGAPAELVVWNKIDLDSAAPPPPTGIVVPCCLLSGEGLPALREALLMCAGAGAYGLGDELVLIGRARHRDAIHSAATALERAVQAAGDDLPLELIALDVRAALDAVGELSGAVTSDDVLNRIFAGFCIGK